MVEGSPPEHGSTCSRVTDSDSDHKSVEELRVTVLACDVACARTGPLWDQLELVRMGLLDVRHTNLASTVQSTGWIDETPLFLVNVILRSQCPRDTEDMCLELSLFGVCVHANGASGYAWLPMAKHGYQWEPIMPMCTHPLDAHAWFNPNHPRRFEIDFCGGGRFI